MRGSDRIWFGMAALLLSAPFAAAQDSEYKIPVIAGDIVWQGQHGTMNGHIAPDGTIKIDGETIGSLQSNGKISMSGRMAYAPGFSNIGNFHWGNHFSSMQIPGGGYIDGDGNIFAPGWNLVGRIDDKGRIRSFATGARGQVPPGDPIEGAIVLLYEQGRD